MRNLPLAYHITFGTYGTRLHGDERGTVTRTHNQLGEPIVGRDEDWEQEERSKLKSVILTIAQRQFIEASIPAICLRGGWQHHISSSGGDHVHVVLTSQRDGKAIRRWLKVWLGQALSEKWDRPVGATWWSEAGSVKKVWNDIYFDNVHQYLLKQRATPRKQ